MSPKTKYIIDGNGVIPVIDVGDGYLVPASTIFPKKDHVVYDDKMDALYEKLVRDLTKGKPLENFKSSKYYKYYVARLKEDHPEYAI